MTSIRRPLLSLLVALALLPVAAASAQEAAPETDGPAEIIGGQRADPHEYPFQVALLHHDIQDRWFAQFCGGTLISPDTVLTAGHCVQGERAATIDILAGTNRLLPGGGQRVRARTVRRHPGYDDNTLEHDIAIIQLRGHLPYPTVAPAVAGQEALYAPGTMATTIGWGDIDIRLNVEHYPKYLHEVEVPTVSDEDCSAAYPGELFANRMVCAGDMVDGGEDSCFGDSGGPLLVPNGGDWLQVGIVSTGRGCARAPFPGIYTEVSAYDDFVTRFLDPDDVPNRVTHVRRQRVTPTAVRLDWNAPFFDGGTRITRYRIDLPDLGRTRTTVGRQRHIRLRHLPPGLHRVTVRAVNRIGRGPETTIYALV